MRKLFGYLLFGLGILIFWPIQIGLGIYGIFYIVKTFIDGGIVAGLISIPIVGVILLIVYMIIHLLAVPYIGLVRPLIESREREVSFWESEEEKQAAIKVHKLEMEHIREQLIKAYMAQGMTEEEARKKANSQ
jgi:hypothetical protein